METATVVGDCSVSERALIPCENETRVRQWAENVEQELKTKKEGTVEYANLMGQLKVLQTIIDQDDTLKKHFYLTGIFKDGKLIQTHCPPYGTTCQKAMREGLSRLISLCLRNGVPKSRIIEELKGIRCNSADHMLPRSYSLSCCDAMANCLKRLSLPTSTEQQS